MDVAEEVVVEACALLRLPRAHKYSRVVQVSDRCHYDYRQSIWHGDEEEKLILSQPYRAPSWSWAAVDNAVSFWVHGSYQVRVSGCFGSTRAITTPLSPGLPFGPIQLLLTRIRCQLRPESVYKSPIDNKIV